MKTWAKITIGIVTALAVVGGGFGLYKVLKKNDNGGNGNDDDDELKKLEEEKNKQNQQGGSSSDSIIGKTAYSPNGVNIRLESKVNNGLYDNIIKEMASGNLGTIVSESKGSADGLRWFYIKLSEPITIYASTNPNKYGKHEYGYVRTTDERGNTIVKVK